jgi:hypothetical protein
LHWLEWRIAAISKRAALWIFRRPRPTISRSAHDSALATDAVLTVEPHFPMPPEQVNALHHVKS